jgi:cell division septum initiation protein DivIVA
MNRMNLVILIDKLDQLIDSAPEIPLTGKALIDAEAALDLIDKIRNAIPEEVKRAEWLTSEKDKVLLEGQAEADRIKLQAEEYAAKMVSDSELVRRATFEAENIIEEARAKAIDIETGANEYADSVLAALHDQLDRTIRVVRKGREELQKTVNH